MDGQPPEEHPTPRNTVTLSLDGDQDEPLRGYRRSQGHFRAWNRSRGTQIDVRNVYGGQREVYTTPPSGTFYYVVRYRGRKLTFVIQGRSGWLVGFYSVNGTYQMKLESQVEPYMKTKDCQILSFKGNHRFISDSNPGSTRVGIHSLRNAFDAIWEFNGANPEPHSFRRAIGIFVVFLCEAAKIQDVFDRVCRSLCDPAISRLDSESGADSQLGDCCQNWSKLSQEGMKNVHHRMHGLPAPDINNHGIQTILTAEDLLRTIRILHRDAYDQGRFSHEPLPSPPQYWEPIDPGDGDSSDSDGENGSDPEDDDDARRRGGRKVQETKYEKRKRGAQKIFRYNSEKKRGSGGEPVNFPDSLLGTWNSGPEVIFANKENEPPALFEDHAMRNANLLTAEPTSCSWFEQGECSNNKIPKLDCLGEKRVWLMVTDLESLLEDETRNSIMLMKGKPATKLIVPLIVIQELERLKQEKGLCGTASKAHSSFKWLEECREDESWWINIQCVSETEMSETENTPTPYIEECQPGGEGSMLSPVTPSSSSLTSDIDASTPRDEYIMRCAVLLNKARGSNETVVILSDSDTLKAKAHGEGLLCERAKYFCDTLMRPSSSRASRAKKARKGLKVLLDKPRYGNQQH